MTYWYGCIDSRLQSSQLLHGGHPEGILMSHYQTSSALICIWIIFILGCMAFSCVPPCQGSFSTRGGLSRHQNGCTTFQTSQELKLQRRRMTSTQIRQSRPRQGHSSQLPHSSHANRQSTPSTSLDSIAVGSSHTTPEPITVGSPHTTWG